MLTRRPGRVCCAPMLRDRRQVDRERDRQQSAIAAARAAGDSVNCTRARIRRDDAQAVRAAVCRACTALRVVDARRNARRRAPRSSARTRAGSSRRSARRSSGLAVRPAPGSRAGGRSRCGRRRDTFQCSAMPGIRRPARVLGHQALVQVAQHVAAGHFRAAVRVEGRGFRAVAAFQRLRRGRKRQCATAPAAASATTGCSRTTVHSGARAPDTGAGLAMSGARAPHHLLHLRSEARPCPVPATCKVAPITDRAQLVDYHRLGRDARSREWRIGTEHEKFGFRLDDLRPPTFEGERGIEALLQGPDPLRLGTRRRARQASSPCCATAPR